MRFYIDFIKRVDEDTLEIEGYSIGVSHEVVRLMTLHGGVMLRANGDMHSHPLGSGGVEQARVVSVQVKLAELGGRLSFFSGESTTPLTIYTNKYSGLATIGGSYTVKGNLVFQKRRRHINVRKKSKVWLLLYEIQYLIRLLVNWRIKDAVAMLRTEKGRASRKVLKAVLIVGEAVVTIPRGIVLRSLYHLCHQRKQRAVWLISDRGMAAGDNGEALFRYLSEHHDDQYNAYFILSRKSSDYTRLQRYGKVLDPGSLMYKLNFLLADKVISSHADVEVTNPFLRQIDRFVGLYGFDFIFLQHGIIRNDLSEWLNRYERNISKFVTSSRREYDSIFKYPYYYDKSTVILTGLPRYDLLESRPDRKLIIAPTYRKNLLRLRSDKYGARGYDELFKRSEYFKFYSRLINDERLHKAMKKAGMTGEFYLHPNFASQRQDFTESELFAIPDYPYDYNKIFKEGSLLVSDYSSTVFDFAYLKKPVVYTQFDIDTFFENHAYSKGDFFSDETDGFGPVAYNYEETIRCIVEAIENDCIMGVEYQERADNFFYKRDKRNAERVYRAIVADDERYSV